MRYMAIAAAALILMGGCATSPDNGGDAAEYTNEVSSGSAGQWNVIVDEEFDLLVAPEYDYETEVPYAEQIKNEPEKKQAKSAKKPVAVKQ